MATVRKITNDTMVECKNGTHGKLVYVSKKNPGVTYEWNEFGEIQEMDYGELVSMRGAQRRFFEDNWVLIEDAEVLKKLGVDKYYKNALTTENFDSVFTWSVDEIKEKIPKMSDGMKDSIRVRAMELIKAGKFDSLASIKAMGEALGCDLQASVEV